MRTAGAHQTEESADAVTPGDPGWELLSAVAAGDELAFERLVGAYQDRLLVLCRRLLGSRAAAEDAVQEVFVKAYRQAGRLEPRGKFYTWLYRVATNHCLNRLRRRRIVRFVPLVSERDPEEESDIEPTDERADPERAAAARQRWRQIERTIAELPPNQRVVLVLARYAGLSYRDIAETLEITPGAVESRLFRAMRTLRRAAQEIDPPGVSP
ncbi:MAG: RNA polymerase sigma factor [Thermoanaerobaculia bacterium]|nr:RNA polymerase sigma factor [Thermoanaerobaculia bacterium]